MKICLFLSLGVTLVSGQSLISPQPRDCREQGFKGGLPPVTVPLPQYYEGQVMIVKANLVAANGNFEFYLCPEANPDDEECLVRIPLRTEDFGKQFDLGEISTAGLYEILLRLPKGITCDSCVLKWVMSVNECSEENDDDCITLTDTVCTDISIVNAPDRRVRGWDFFDDTVSSLLDNTVNKLIDI
ncbi:uncharacterized protein [Palaemon carinicauda]|uniref:uncharacterized protein n=1 Tax=Palaemon carinicauda TaxID=392227 RepID=UPI0035B62069